MTQTQEFLILGVVLAIVWGLLAVMFSYYFVMFKKANAEQKLYGTAMIVGTLVLWLVILAAWIIMIIFYTIMEKEDGPLVDNNDPYAAASIAMAVIGYVGLAAGILMEWFFLPYYGIAFVGKPGEGKIMFMGEQINYAQITKIVIDTKTRKTYINRRAGKRTYSRLAFSPASAFGLFIRTNADLTGHAAEEIDEDQYFKELKQQGSFTKPNSEKDK